MAIIAAMVSLLLCLCIASPAVGGDVKNARGYLRDTFVISGHRGGGRVHAPDNSMPNIEFAIQHQLTAVEVDLRLTRDGRLILWHDSSFPKRYLDPAAAEGERVAVAKLSAEQVRRIRYSATAGGRAWKDVRVAFAADLPKVTKGRVNLHLDVKDVPAARVIEFIRRHGLQAESMVMSGRLDYLQAIRAAEPDVCLEYADNTLGRRKVDGKWEWYPAEKQHRLYHERMKALAAAGVDALCTKGLTKQKVAICHQYGILVRTSANHLQTGQPPDRYVDMGVDYALTDDPLLMEQAVRKLRPGVSLSRPGQTFLELIRGRRLAGLRVTNGWYVHKGRAIWGYGQHNGWWRPGQRPNLTRNAPGTIAPNRTEDLARLTDAMLRYAYPGFEHNFGLWYDRRRDAHDTARRRDAKARPPFLEQPWARSGKGTAWDGLSKYDLTKYNDWYFRRLREFASLCDRKGTILFHNHYMQHALLETNAHYVDFPWRPANCIQDTRLPDRTPVANAFYDLSHPARRALHRAYIRKCLDELGAHTNVVFLCSEEYTGPLSFMKFWLDSVFEWEDEKGRDVHVGLGGCKDVLDAVLADPRRRARVSTIDLRYWWYEPDGKLFAPKGGRQVAGRFTGRVERTSPEQFHRQIREYRLRYPRKAILHGIPGSRQHAWAALTAGGSMLIGQMPYPGLKDPARYISPERCRAIQPAYDFIRTHLATALPRMRPQSLVLDHPGRNGCLANTGRAYLVYALKGGRFRLDLSAATGSLEAKWLNPRTGELTDANGGRTEEGRTVAFTAPDSRDWALWLTRAGGFE